MKNIKKYQGVIRDIIKKNLLLEPQYDQKYYHYVLNSGKRFRPAIILALAPNIAGKHFALYVEYFHTACFSRRSQEDLSDKYGNTVAIQTKFNLLQLAYQQLSAGMAYLSSEKEQEIRTDIETYRTNKLYPDDYKDWSLRRQQEFELQQIKLNSIFGTCFVLGCAAGEICVEQEKIRCIGDLFSLCYQIVSDLRYRRGLCKLYTHNQIVELFKQSLAALTIQIKETSLDRPLILELLDYFVKAFTQYITTIKTKTKN